MLGKPVWFKARKYSGWGLYPQTWQGWVYILAVVAAFLILSRLPFGAERYRNAAYIGLAAIIVLDIMDIMVRMPRDERERVHEAIAERNATWAMLVVLGFGLVYRAYTSPAGTVYVDPVIISALIGGLAVKAVSNFYLDKKD